MPATFIWKRHVVALALVTPFLWRVIWALSSIPGRRRLFRRLALARRLTGTVLRALGDKLEKDLRCDFNARVTREERAEHLHLGVGEEVDIVVEI